MMEEKKILIVDDILDNLIILKSIINQYIPDIVVITTQSATEGLEILNNNTIDCILSDVQMPEMDGIEMCSKIKSNSSTSRIPVMLISSHSADSCIKVKGLEAGANDFISRPINNEELASKLKVMIRISSAEKKLLQLNTEQKLTIKNKSETISKIETNFEAILNSMTEAVISIENSGVITKMNPMAEKLTGWKQQDIKDNNIEQILNLINPKKNSIPSIFGLSSKMSLTNQLNINADLISKENKIYSIEGTVTLIQNSSEFLNSHNGFVIVFKDISSRKKEEEEKERLLLAIGQAAEMIVITDSDGIIQYVNPAIEKVSGFTPERVLGINPRFLKSGVQDEKFYKKMWKTLQSGEIWRGRVVNRKKDSTLYTEEKVISPVINDTGCVVNYVSVSRDITKEIAQEEKIKQSEKMDVIGQLAGGIAHDFNNILGGIIGFSELTMRIAEKESKIERNLKHILKAGIRGKELVKQILTFSSQKSVVKEPIFINPIINEVIGLLKSTIPSTIEIKYTNIKESLPIESDSILIHEIVLNLCTNAAYALGNRGNIDISLTEETITSDVDCLMGRIEPGRYSIISVKDNGSGMNKEVLSHIFDPFYTTKPTGKGSGMGLSVLYGIVQDHNGNIVVETDENWGTIFKIYLPKSKRQYINKESEDIKNIDGGKEKIFFIDDEEILCTLAYEYLSELGYDVCIFTDSLMALEKFKIEYKSVEMVITDHTMPKLTGFDLAKEMLSIKKDLSIILCTGYSKNVDKEVAIDAGFSDFFLKPYKLDDLACNIKSIFKKQVIA